MPTQTPSDTHSPWQGFHHIALVTPDLDATVRFYHDVLGMQVGEIMDRRGKHCFIRPGESETWGLHFFEYPDAQLFPYPDPAERYVFLPGALQHIAFALPDEAAALALRERLRQHHIETTAINDLGAIRNFLFLDHNGMLLEATWPKR